MNTEEPAQYEKERRPTKGSPVGVEVSATARRVDSAGQGEHIVTRAQPQEVSEADRAGRH